ncbi:unnamed protein product [Urochloa humidicola]
MEGKTEPAAATVKGKTTNTRRGVARVIGKTKPEPKVVAVRTEKVDDYYIQYLLKNPMKRPKPLPKGLLERFPDPPESLTADIAVINKVIDLDEYIVKQYYDKGHAIVRVEYLDNGRKRLFMLPEEATA